MRNRERYHPNWNDIIRPEILKRDKYKCQNCGLKHRGIYLFTENGKHIEIDREEYEECLRSNEVVKVIYLQVAHLDHNPKNNNYSNLLSLCPKCHLNNDREVNNLKKLMKTSK